MMLVDQLRDLPVKMIAAGFSQEDIGAVYEAKSIIQGAIPCPADPALSAEHGSPSGAQSPGPGLADFQIQLLSALIAQTEAITRLAKSNEALVQAMAESEGMDEDGPSAPQYLGRAR